MNSSQILALVIIILGIITMVIGFIISDNSLESSIIVSIIGGVLFGFGVFYIIPKKMKHN